MVYTCVSQMREIFTLSWPEFSETPRRLPKISDNFPKTSERCRKCPQMFRKRLSNSNHIKQERFVAERVWFSYSKSSLLNIFFRLSGFQSSILLFTTATVRIPVQSVAQKLSDTWRTYRRGAASPRYRKRAKITVRVCNRKPNPVWFSCRCKSHPV